jgi:hypothetical protein
VNPNPVPVKARVAAYEAGRMRLLWVKDMTIPASTVLRLEVGHGVVVRIYYRFLDAVPRGIAVSTR